MKVLKFGGSSLSNSKKISRIAEIIIQSSESSQISVVLSAMGKTTDHLVTLISISLNTDSFTQEIENLKQLHLDTLNELIINDSPNRQIAKDKIELLFSLCENYLQGIQLLKDCPSKIESWILTLGENLSVTIMNALLNEKGLKTTVLDPKEFIILDKDESNEVDQTFLCEQLSAIKPKLNQISLMPGFEASNNQNEIATLGRNGSDYSAALLAIGLKAELCEIWTDVDGVFTANPAVIPQAQQIKNLSYKEAMELSFFGASVLHPKTITPLMQFDIPCQIRNTNNKNNSGTLIDSKPFKTSSFATAISSLDNISMITVSGPGMKGKVGMASRVFECMSKDGISVIVITQSSSEYSISFCIDTNDINKGISRLNKEFKLELAAQLLNPIKATSNLAVISLVSDNMKKRKGTASQFFNALAIANVNVYAIAQGSNERSISAVIKHDKLLRGLKSCHQLFFDTKQVAEIILIGNGLVGQAFLKQVSQQSNYLENNNIRIKICGIVNTKGIIFDEAGIDIEEEDFYSKYQPQELTNEVLLNFRQSSNMINPIIVDCTSSQKIADSYLDYFNAGFHVVAANKKANTSSDEYYQTLKEQSRANHRQFHYETNVGAGLPLVDTFKNLMSAGDQLIEFQGILSGSMSYIFGKLDSGTSFSQAVLEAKELGFTEPDPRDDLSGTDVARKVLIIAREANLNLELSDIKVESILSSELMELESVDIFLKNLPEFDHHITSRVKNAQKNSKVLRYVGSIKEGQCEVKIEEISKESALHSVKDGENAITLLSHYYQPIPMVLRGYGAGANVTAAGIFSDVLKILPSKSSYL